MTLIIIVYFDGARNRCRVFNALMNHDGMIFALVHVCPEEGQEYIVFKIEDKANVKLRQRLNVIADDNACTVRIEPYPGGRIQRVVSTVRTKLAGSDDNAIARESLREITRVVLNEFSSLLGGSSGGP